MHIFRIIELGLIFLSAVAHVNGASGEISSSSSSSELNKLQEQLHIYDAVDPAHSIHSRLLLNTASSKQDGEEEHEEHIQRRAMPLSSLPDLDDIDSIEVYHLQSKKKLLVHTAVGSFAVRTSGLALRSTTTNRVVVLEYRPVNYDASYLPKLGPAPVSTTAFVDEGQNSSSISLSLLWDNRATIEYTASLDTTHWQQSTFLGTINGIVYSNYVAWLHDYITNNLAATFVPQAICSSLSARTGPDGKGAQGRGIDDSSCFNVANTWENFISSSLGQFAEMSVNMHAMLAPRASELQMLSNVEPEIVRADPRSTQHGTVSMRKRQQRRRTDHQQRQQHLRSLQTVSSADDATDTDNEMPSFIADIITAKGGKSSVSAISEADIYYFYSQLIVCMNGYTNEDYTSALTSCIGVVNGVGGDVTDIAYVHLWGNYYYLIQPRHPFAADVEFFQTIPAAKYPQSKGVLTSDWVIGVMLLSVITCGLLLALKQLKVYETECCSWLNGGASTIHIKKRTSYSGGIIDGATMGINSSSSSYWGRGSGGSTNMFSGTDMGNGMGTGRRNGVYDPLAVDNNIDMDTEREGAKNEVGNSIDVHVYRQHPMFLSQSHMYTFPRIQATTPTVLNVISSTSDNDRDVIDNINSSNVDVNIDNAPGTGSKGAQLGKANL